MEVPQTEPSVERTEEQLVELVKNQVEYYFSKENLMGDPFLSSQMDAQMCVPISIVMKVRTLTAHRNFPKMLIFFSFICNCLIFSLPSLKL